MKKEDWAYVEEVLSGLYGSVDLKVDGAVITLQRRLIKKNQLGILTYVNGWIKGIWTDIEAGHPETQYLRPVSKLIYNAKERATLKKASKKTLKSLVIDPDARHNYVSLYWHSVSSIRKHYEKTFKSIELILPEE